MAEFPGKEVMITDVCVPISRLAELMEKSKLDLDKSPLPAPVVAHGETTMQLLA